MKVRRAIGRRFPDYGWAWPRGELDRLLKALLLRDDEAALRAGLGWLGDNDIDATEFREQRLLAALSDRFGKRLNPSPAQPRLVGLQRLLWSKSRMALRESREALAALVGGAVSYMLIKGASRVALDPASQRGRVSHDIDILVRPAEMKRAFEILLDSGWRPASGAGALRLLSEASAVRAMNFFKGSYGDVDLHQAAYHPIHASPEDDEGLWQRSLACLLDGIPARAPSAGDRVALAIAHGGLDAHTHSDWLVDIDSAVRGDDVDWDRLVATLGARRLLVPAASALTYLAMEIGSPIPESTLDAIVEAADAQGLAGRLGLLEIKPRTDFNGFSGAARAMVKQLRLWRSAKRTAAITRRLWRTRIARRFGDPQMGYTGLVATIPVEGRRIGTARIVVRIALPGVARRVEMELSTGSRHLAMLRYRKLSGYRGLRELTFEGHLELGEGEDCLVLEARPSRSARQWDDARDVERYGALPFSVQRVSIR